MNKRETLVALPIFMIVFCCLLASVYLLFRPMLTQPKPATDCTAPPAGFSKSDLFGTWVAGVPSRKDTLILSDNGTYQQIVHLDIPPTNYQSEWRQWRLEYDPSGIAYLHLEGMSLCGLNPEISCSDHSGGGYDFCKDQSIPASGEGILLVLGVPKEFIEEPGANLPLRGINLWYPLGSENTWVYRLRQP